VIGQVIVKEILLGKCGGSFYLRQLLLVFICYHVSDSRLNKQMQIISLKETSAGAYWSFSYVWMFIYYMSEEYRFFRPCSTGTIYASQTQSISPFVAGIVDPIPPSVDYRVVAGLGSSCI